MNLLTHHTPTSDDVWKRDFGAHAETSSTAGLTLLQLWRDVEGSGVTGLFKVDDRGRAWRGQRE